MSRFGSYGKYSLKDSTAIREGRDHHQGSRGRVRKELISEEDKRASPHPLPETFPGGLQGDAKHYRQSRSSLVVPALAAPLLSVPSMGAQRHSAPAAPSHCCSAGTSHPLLAVPCQACSHIKGRETKEEGHGRHPELHTQCAGTACKSQKPRAPSRSEHWQPSVPQGSS